MQQQADRIKTIPMSLVLRGNGSIVLDRIHFNLESMGLMSPSDLYSTRAGAEEMLAASLFAERERAKKNLEYWKKVVEGYENGSTTN